MATHSVRFETEGAEYSYNTSPANGDMKPGGIGGVLVQRFGTASADVLTIDQPSRPGVTLGVTIPGVNGGLEMTFTWGGTRWSTTVVGVRDQIALIAGVTTDITINLDGAEDTNPGPRAHGKTVAEWDRDMQWMGIR